MQLLKEKSSHWYRFRNGAVESCHEWPKKDKSGMKRTTLREAKEHHLFPSVTNVIDSVIAKPQLTNWLITQGIMSALTLPRVTGENEDTFATRVVDDMDAYSAERRDFGTDCHDHIAHFIETGEVIYNEAEPFTRGAREWITSNVLKIIGAEQNVAHPELCIAGRLDLHAELRKIGEGVIDFKSQNVRKKGDQWNPVFYDEFPVQIAAYAACVRHADDPVYSEHHALPKLVSIIINSAEPSEAFVKIYENGEYYLRLFKHALDWWCYKKDYDPRTGAAPVIESGPDIVQLLVESIQTEQLKAQRKGMERAGDKQAS